MMTDPICSNSAVASKTRPRVSAVVCAYNPPAIWRDVVARLCSFPFAEVLVVDDGSTTPLELIVPKNGKAPVRFLRFAENRGLAAARNCALENIETDWVLFVDSDVLPSNFFLETLPARLQTAEADGFGFHVMEHNRRSDWDFFRAHERACATMHGQVEWLSGLLCVYRTAVLRSVNGFDSAFRTNGEDVDLGYRLTLSGKTLVRVPEVCGQHHRKDTLLSFLQMHYRYALTAKRVDRSRYFLQTGKGSRKLPLFHSRSVWPQIRVMLGFLLRRPYAFYLPPLIIGAMLAGACAGRKAVHSQVSSHLSPRMRTNLAVQ
jgi:GT2 family glycosyltransferase